MHSHGLVQSLTESFKSEAVEKKYHEATQERLRQKLYTRVFNVHTPLFSQSDLAQAWKCYFDKSLFGGSDLRKIKRVQGEDSLHYEFVNTKDRERVLRLVHAVVAHACNQLLDTNGRIKRELIHLLGWWGFKAEIQQTAVITQIIRSYVESVMGGMLTQVGVQANKSISGSAVTHLLYLDSCVNRIAQNSYNQFIKQRMAGAVQFNSYQDSAAKFIAALPDPVAESLISGLMKQDFSLSHKKPYASLHKAYSAFWVHALLECLALRRLDVLDVMLTELRRYVRVSELASDLRRQYEFCIEQVMQMRLVSTDNSLSMANASASLDAIQRILALRDHFVTMTAIITEYIGVDVERRSFVEGDILTRLEQGVAKNTGHAALSLFERLSLAEKACRMHQVESGAFAKIILKYKMFFAGKEDVAVIAAKILSEKSAAASAAYSDAETMGQLGLHKVSRSPVSEESASDQNTLESKDKARHGNRLK